MWKPAVAAALLLGAAAVHAQTPCAPTPVYSPCDLVFDAADLPASPYERVEMHAEFRSPRHRTYKMPAFFDGGKRLVIRFAPVEAGQWDYRVTSSIAAYNGKTGQLQAVAAEAPGFVKAANVHHFAFTENNTPHLWMGTREPRLAFVDDASAAAAVERAAAAKFNHLRLSVLGTPVDSEKIFPSSGQPDVAFFQQLDSRILSLNRKGIVADLTLASGPDHLTTRWPQWQQRERLMRYLVARYSSMNVTWQGVDEWESYATGRELLKEVGALLKKMDPYQHPRSTGAAVTSAALLEDGWMDHVTQNSPDPAVGAVEHQLYGVPFVNTGFVKGEGADAFRKGLWHAAMNGQYVEAAAAGPAEAKALAVWFDFFSGTRHWDLEPYFDVDGGRGMALEEIEYIAYIEKPGPVEVLVEKHGYDVRWVNPVNGEAVNVKKGYKGEKFTGEPPDAAHDWVLQISREGKKESMLKSYKFEARRILMQELEQNPQKVPFEIEAPGNFEMAQSAKAPYAAKIKRETRATRSMLWLWTGEVAADGQGYRVLGTSQKGEFSIPANIARRYPAVLHLRVAALNGNGKAYTADKTYQLTR